MRRALATAAFLSVLVATATGCAGSADEESAGSEDALSLLRRKSPIAPGLYTDGADSFVRVVDPWLGAQQITWTLDAFGIGGGKANVSADSVAVTNGSGTDAISITVAGANLSVVESKGGARQPARSLHPIAYGSFAKTQLSVTKDPTFHVIVGDLGETGADVAIGRDGVDFPFVAHFAWSADRAGLEAPQCGGIRYALSLHGTPTLTTTASERDVTDACTMIADLRDASQGVAYLK